jgi:hypothetical protein
VREFVEDFLKARGEWDTAWNRYVDARSSRRDILRLPPAQLQ